MPLTHTRTYAKAHTAYVVDRANGAILGVFVQNYHLETTSATKVTMPELALKGAGFDTRYVQQFRDPTEAALWAFEIGAILDPISIILRGD